MVRTCVRRLAKVALILGAATLVLTLFRRRRDDLDHIAPGAHSKASWPPLDADVGGADAAPSTGVSGETAAVTVAPDPVISEPSDGAAAEAPQDSWTEPGPEGDCPLTHPVKVKLRSGIYHVPEGLAYTRTNADRCYTSPETAEADGYRASKM